MILISLFSGIGGFELAAEWMGWQVGASCEINPFGQKILKYHFPKAYHHDDIHTLTYEKINQELTQRFGQDWRSNGVILTGGFPCQPYSTAGKRLGKEDDRHLWPEMLRIIREVKPDWIVGENVLGIVSWNGGLVFNEVQVDLEAEGYEVQPFVLPAAAVNAPHRRDRVWFVAYLPSKRLERSARQGIQGAIGRFTDKSNEWPTPDTDSRGLEGSVEVGRNSEYVIGENGIDAQTRIASDTNSARIQGQPINTRTSKEIRQRRKSFEKIGDNGFIGGWNTFPTQSPICSRNDGLPSRLDGITFSKWRNESIKAGGNAIVPQVAFQIFKAIDEYDRLMNF